jgi:hypothetical protein
VGVTNKTPTIYIIHLEISTPDLQVTVVALPVPQGLLTTTNEILEQH